MLLRLTARDAPVDGREHAAPPACFPPIRGGTSHARPAAPAAPALAPPPRGRDRPRYRTRTPRPKPSACTGGRQPAGVEHQGWRAGRPHQPGRWR